MKTTFTASVAQAAHGMVRLSLCLLLLLSLNQAVLAQSLAGKFVDVTNKVPQDIQLDDSKAAWADYDGDGLQDFFIFGKVSTYHNDAWLFRNTGNGWENVTHLIKLPGGLKLGSVAWGDYDGDKRPDLLLTGDYGYTNDYPYSALYHNTPDGFVDVTAEKLPGLPQLTHSTVSWADVNHDEWLDFVIMGGSTWFLLPYHCNEVLISNDPPEMLCWRSGYYTHGRLYLNNRNGTFTDETKQWMPAGWADATLYNASVAWGDMDKDGLLDLMVSGVKDVLNYREYELYKNMGNRFEQWAFPEESMNLKAVGSSIAWVENREDQNHPSDSYLITTGNVEQNGAPGDIGSQIFRYTGAEGFSYEDVTAKLIPDLPQVTNSAVAWFDVNNDKRMDLFISGETGFRSDNRSKLYLNTSNGFVDVTNQLMPDVASTVFGSASVADYDKDGRQDLLLTGWGTTRIYRNEVTKGQVGGTGLVNLRYGGSAIDRFTVVIQTADGGYVSGGYSNSAVSGDKSQSSRGGADYWIVKTDKDGTKQWDQRYGGTNHDYLNRIIPTQDGGYLLAGSSTSGVGGDKSQGSRGKQDYWIVKINGSGVKQWDQTYGGSGFDDLRKVNLLANGDYLLAGTSNSPVSGDKSQASQGGTDYWVVRISNTGERIWDKRYGGPADEYLESFTKTKDGGFLLAGSSASGKSGDKSQASRGGKDYWLVKIDQQGKQLWDKSYGGSGDEELYSIGITRKGGYFVAGHSTSGMSGEKSQASQGASDYWMLKLTSNGEKLWDKSFGGNGTETLRSIIQVQGGYVLAGSSDSNISGDKTQASRGGRDYWIVKTDAAGNKEYDYRFGGSGDEEFRYIQRTEDGGLLLGGRSDSGVSGDRTQPSQGSTDYWLVKVALGNPASSPAARVRVEPEPTTPNQQVRVYPNPAADKLTVKLTRPAQQVQTSITDLTGAVRKSNAHRQVDSSTLEIMVSQLPAAVYLLQLQTEYGQHTLKFVKQ